MASDITINYFHRSIRDDIILSYLERKPFLLSLLSFDNKNKNLDSNWSIRPTSTSIREYVAKILSWMREKPGASEKNDFPLCVSWIYRIFFLFYFVVSMTIERSDRERLRISFFIFFICLCLTCTGRTRSRRSVYSWRICRNSATLPCTRSSRNSSSRNGSTPAREAPCTLDRFWNERRRWLGEGYALIIGNFGDFEINHWKLIRIRNTIRVQ